MRITDLLNNIYQEYNNNSAVVKRYQPKENNKVIKPFKLAVEELCGEQLTD